MSNQVDERCTIFSAEAGTKTNCKMLDMLEKVNPAVHDEDLAIDLEG